MGVTKQALVAASVAGLLALAGAASAAHHDHGAAGGSDAPCYGINKCKGAGECGGKGSSCAGSNACKGQGWLKLNKETCLKIEGGRLTEDASAS
jgi:uncharacterized membrane protein